ncbi:MAG: hypothetical protein Kow0098_21570 [Ignavibacteriaceae bacterium]
MSPDNFLFRLLSIRQFNKIKISTVLITILFLCAVFPGTGSAQEYKKVIVNKDNDVYKVNAYSLNEELFISLEEIAEILSVPVNTDTSLAKTELFFTGSTITISGNNPYAIITDKMTNKKNVYQFTTSTHLIDYHLFINIKHLLNILNSFYERELSFIEPDTVEVGDYRKTTGKENFLQTFSSGISDSTKIESITIEKGLKETLLRISISGILPESGGIQLGNLYRIVFTNTSYSEKGYLDIDPLGYVKAIKVAPLDGNFEIQVYLTEDSLLTELIKDPSGKNILLRIFKRSEAEWFTRESEHFKIIYRESHSHLVTKILSDAENSLNVLMKIFNYLPTEKIIINTYDASDYGFGGTTTVPQNFIRLEIEPLEPGYESTPYNDRFQWLLSHELVHIMVNDHSSDTESFFRSVFGKVEPVQQQPVSILFSLLTNYTRFTPRWYQEAIAVFMETWMSGGYGRIMGSFDEMFFRAMVADNADFPGHIELDALTSHNSVLLQTIFYLYGTRFIAYLTYKFGSEKLIEWFRTKPGDLYPGYLNKFEDVFETDFDVAWQDFITFEKEFQRSNISKIKSSPLSPVRKLMDNPLGWVSQPHYDKLNNTVYFGYHKSHKLAAIGSLNLNDQTFTDIGSLPSPSMIQVASVGFDNRTGFLFYTTNNNQLYRDIHVLDVKNGDEKLLFENFRVGALTVSETTSELWGIQHVAGYTRLVYSAYPYEEMIPVVSFDIGEELTQLAVSNNGDLLAAVIHKLNGNQQLVIADVDGLKSGGPFRYKVISSSGTPENPSWSNDDNFLFWNAYTNGVSNIYRINLSTAEITAVSNTIYGFFRPVQLNNDSLFAFQFSENGFIPVIIPDKPVEKLPAIEYLGQKILNQEPELFDWVLRPSENVTDRTSFSAEEDYNGLGNLKIQSFIPIISGFQIQKVIGFYSHISDPLLNHDIKIQAGYSPFNEQPLGPKFHLKIQYDFKQRLVFAVDHNAPDFYDLFNERKRGMIGTKIRVGHTGYWLYDNPHKIKQQSEIALYTGIEFINDNLTRVSQPDFMVAQTNFNSRNLRRSIGSSDFESGDEISITFMGFGSDPDNPQYAGELHAEWDRYSLWLFPHNVFHYKIAAGYHYINEDLFQARYFFGGFGNREVENENVKQFRKVFRFPGIPIYSLAAERFVKVTLENNFPPLRFANASIGQHFLNHIDLSVFSQALLVKSDQPERWIDIGAQINFIFKHWFNLESTFSAGIAKAWSESSEDYALFLSYKLLKN